MNDLFFAQLSTDQDFSSFVLYDELFLLYLGGDEFLLTLDDLDGFDFEGILTILGEWPDEGVQAHHGFWSG